MIQINVLELALRDPSRRTADLAGRTRHAASESHTTYALRPTRRLILRRRSTAEH